MKRLLSLALIVLGTVTFAGCGDSGTGPAGSLAGTYSLQTIDNNPLPATLYYASASDHIEILRSALTLYSNGSYTDVTRVQDTQYGSTTVYDDNTQGTWSLSGSQLALVDSNDPTHVTYGQVTNGRLEIDNFSGYGVVAVYLK